MSDHQQTNEQPGQSEGNGSALRQLILKSRLNVATTPGVDPAAMRRRGGLRDQTEALGRDSIGLERDSQAHDYDLLRPRANQPRRVRGSADSLANPNDSGNGGDSIGPAPSAPNARFSNRTYQGGAADSLVSQSDERPSFPAARPIEDRPAALAHGYAPLPEGVDLSAARFGKAIKSGAFGSVSWVDGAVGAPPLVIKVPRTRANRAELEHEEAFYAKVGEHPNIAACLGMQSIQDQEGLVLEGIDGRDMHAVMDKLEALSKGDMAAMAEVGMDGALSHTDHVGTLQYMLAQTLEGLAHLQDVGVVHSDIRPDNVMCDAQTGAVKIVDFGLAFDADQPFKPGMVPVGHGMVPPERIDTSATITAKADVFAAGEFARKGMERDQFRYELPPGSEFPDAKHVEAFGKKDSQGRDKQALNPMAPPASPPEASASNLDRVQAMAARMTRLVRDPFQKGSKAMGQLDATFRSVLTALKAIGLDDPKAVQIIAAMEKRISVAEKNLKTSGTYAAETAYTTFVNWAMHPDPAQRPTAREALAHPFMADRLLDDESAQAVLKRILNPGGAQGGGPSGSGASGSPSRNTDPGSGVGGSDAIPAAPSLALHDTESVQRIDDQAQGPRSAQEDGRAYASTESVDRRNGNPAEETFKADEDGGVLVRGLEPPTGYSTMQQKTAEDEDPRDAYTEMAKKSSGQSDDGAQGSSGDQATRKGNWIGAAPSPGKKRAAATTDRSAPPKPAWAGAQPGAPASGTKSGAKIGAGRPAPAKGWTSADPKPGPSRGPTLGGRRKPRGNQSG